MKKSVFFLIGFSFVLSACEEDTLSDDYYKEYAYQKKFEQQFGPIAPGHQWGFDVAEAAFNVQDEITRAVIKAEEVVVQPNIHAFELYGKTPDITDREHEEVYAWFSNHKVEWKTPMTFFNGTHTRDLLDDFARVIDSSNPGYGSLLDPSYNNPLGDYEPNVLLTFHHGWVQHVAANFNEETVYLCPTGSTDPGNYKNQDGSWKDTTTTMVKASHMDYLQCWGIENNTWQAHLKDFNSAQGWGYYQLDENQNAELVTYADIDNWSYGSSPGSSLPHDKFFVVYLKGDDYEGWYLGFDFESYGEQTASRIKCDGICNDWIIKITDVGNVIESPEYRIMCEDLGGSFDMDFNDLVFDVKYDNHLVTITVQAAGGTIPIRLQYADTPLEKNGVSEIHSLFGANLDQPVNVGQGVTKPTFQWVIAFQGAQSDATFDYDMRGKNLFHLSDINIYKRNEQAEWIPVTYSDKNVSAPFKFAVPITTRWMKELQTITWGYEDFDNWVQDPTVKFWNGTLHTEFLY